MSEESFHNEADLLSDEELDLLTNYVGGCMTADEEEAFDDRMAGDDAFFERMAPMVRLWYSPPPSVIAAGERVKVKLVEANTRAAGRRAAGERWRHHVWIALASLSAAASVIFGAVLQLPPHPELPGVATRPPASDHTNHGGATPPTHIAAVTPGPGGVKTTRHVAKHPVPADSGRAQTVEEVAMPPLPQAGFTPAATVIAQNDGIILRGVTFVPEPRDLGSDISFMIPPAPGGGPCDNAMAGKGFHFPWIILEPWRWFHR